MTNSTMDFDREWAKLKDYFQKIFENINYLYEQKRDTTKCLTRVEYMEIYNTIYNMSIKKDFHFDEILYKKFDEIIKEYYQKFVLTVFKDKGDDELLMEIKKRWKNHQDLLHLLTNLFSYINRSYVIHHNMENLEAKGAKAFWKFIFEDSRMKVISIFLRELHKDREEIKIDRNLLKEISNIFLKMSTDKSPCYKELEENPSKTQIIEDSKTFYQQLFSVSTQSWNCSEHLREVVKLLESETQRCEECLSQSSTIRQILKEFNRTLIGDYKAILLEKGFEMMLRNKIAQDLNNVFRLYLRLDDNFEGIRQKFKDFVVDKGLELIENKKEELKKLQGEDNKKFLNDTNDPKFILSLVTFNDEHADFIEKSFQNNCNFTIVYREALTQILNSDLGQFSFAEYLAKFSDKIMRKVMPKGRKLQEDEVESYVEKIIRLFDNLNDKDLFIAIYKNFFSERLIQEKEKIDFETEKLIISKIKMSCGNQYTKDLEGMLQDYNLSSEINAQFQDKAKSFNTSVEFSIRVLCKANWPIEKNYSVILPKALAFWKTEFDEFYKKTNSNYKVLEWVYSLSSLTVRMVLEKSVCKVTMSMYQAAVLFLLEAQKNGLFLKEIAEQLSFPEELCQKLIKSMSTSQCKLIEKKEERYSLNLGFVATGPKEFSVPFVSNKEKISKERLVENRELAIEAAIVRVMKSRKTLKLVDLVEEVAKLLYQFNATKDLIKKKIDGLLAKDYLERDPKDVTVFKYKA